MKNNNNKKMLKFVGKAAIGLVASAILTPPVALYIGGWTLFTMKCVEQMVEKEEDKAELRFMADCAKNVAFDGLLDCIVKTDSFSLLSETTSSIGRKASEEIARNGMSEIAKELIEFGRMISKLQRKYKNWNKIKENLEIPKASLKLLKHKIHLDNNINYSESCEVCNV